jgi:hypothetical protein
MRRVLMFVVQAMNLFSGREIWMGPKSNIQPRMIFVLVSPASAIRLSLASMLLGGWVLPGDSAEWLH